MSVFTRGDLSLTTVQQAGIPWGPAYDFLSVFAVPFYKIITSPHSMQNLPPPLDITLEEVGTFGYSVGDALVPDAFVDWVSVGDPSQRSSAWMDSIVEPIADYVMSWLPRAESPVRPTPAPQLVGVELNPGPVTVKASKAELKRARKALQTVVQSTPKAGKPKKNHGKRKPQEEQKTFAPVTAAASAYSGGVTTRMPKISRTNDRCTIEHTELLASVTGSADFACAQYVMQPGLGSVFRWLSTQTSGWEKYKWRYLTATYKTRTGTSTPGTLIMAPDYDATDNPPTSELAISSFYGAQDDAPWKTITVHFDMKRSRELFLRNGPLVQYANESQDPKNSDFATLNVATLDGTAVSWGKISLSYGVDLLCPQMVDVVGAAGTVTTAGGSISAALPFGATPAVVAGCCVSGAGGNVISLSNLIVGNEYSLSIYTVGTGVTNLAIATAGLTFKTGLGGFANAGSTNYHSMSTYTASAPEGSFTLTFTATTITGNYAIVSAVQNSTF